jgi:hypothetical protein
MTRHKPELHTFEEQLAAEKKRLEGQLVNPPEGPEKEALLSKIMKLGVASYMNDWLPPPGSRVS